MCLWGLCGGGGVRGLLRALGSVGIISSPPWPFPGNKKILMNEEVERMWPTSTV